MKTRGRRLPCYSFTEAYRRFMAELYRSLASVFAETVVLLQKSTYQWFKPRLFALRSKGSVSVGVMVTYYGRKSIGWRMKGWDHSALSVMVFDLGRAI